MNSLQVLREFRTRISENEFEGSDKYREELMLEARKIILQLERPQNVIHRIGFQTMESVACSIACRNGIFQALVTRSPQHTSSIADHCGMDSLLAGRILRCLAAHGAVMQLGPDLYSANMVARTLARPASKAAIASDVNLMAPSWLVLTDFLKAENWQNWTGSTETPMSKAWNWPKTSTMFESMDTNPYNADFNAYMAVFDEGHQPWLNFYPASERLIEDSKKDPDSTLMVDVGGGLGHQAVKFKAKFPLSTGRLVVQDLAHALPNPVDQVEGVQYVASDFFTNQPIRGARFYYLRYIMHDWKQELAAEICRNIRDAMEPGYSKLIINDWIIPEEGPTMLMTSQDLNLLCCTGGMERTEALHREYLDNAGLKITGVFRADDNISEGVIEAMVA